MNSPATTSCSLRRCDADLSRRCVGDPISRSTEVSKNTSAVPSKMKNASVATSP